MANELQVGLDPGSLCGVAGAAPYGSMEAAASFPRVGLTVGMGFVPGKTNSSYYYTRIANAVALVTGLTIELLLSEDVSPGNIDPVNKNAVFGVTIGPVTSGTSQSSEVTASPLASCTEVTGTVTMPATAGVLKTLAIAIPIANMNSLAAGGWALIRIRRLGSNASDKSQNNIVLLGADVRNT